MDMLNQTARITAEGLGAEYCKVMEYIPGENRLLVRAGVGWDPGVVGSATVGADLDSPGGYALRTGKPVISNHLENEQRFRTPELLVEHGIRRAMNVILQGDGAPFGVLEVDGTSEGEFSEHDIAFLQGAANILGMAIEQQQYQRKLHLGEQLNEAASRVNAVGRAYERLAYTADYEKIDLIEYLRQIVGDLKPTTAPCAIAFTASGAIQFAADRAILVGLIVTELASNAGKYAYPDGAGGPIWITAQLQPDEQTVLISVRDEGVGLPPDFNPASSKRLGSRLVNALSKQLRGELNGPTSAPGTNFTLLLPL
jgi:two-component sensor histidine kinase